MHQLTPQDDTVKDGTTTLSRCTVKRYVSLLRPYSTIWTDFQDWDAHWTFENTDGNLVWGPDPYLTGLGESQAAAVYQAWLREFQYGAPITSNEMKWYVSPMTRACQTMVGSFGRFLPGVEGREGVAPEIWEDWREVYGSHTCDKRSPKVSVSLRPIPSHPFKPPSSYGLALTYRSPR